MLKIVKSWRPPTFFLLSALVFGLGFVVINPPLAVNDEDAHLARIYELATGRLITRSDGQGEYHYVPEDYAALSAAYAQIRPPGEKARVAPGELWQLLRAEGSGNQVRVAGRAGTYAPICYVPQILALTLLRPFQVSVLVHLYAERLASLLQYVGLAWMAISVSARLQWIFIVIALTPIALTQAAGVSADGTVIGLALLFFAIAGKAICTKEAVGRGELLAMSLAAIALTVCKPVYLLGITCLPALFWTRPNERWKTASLLVAVSALAVTLYLGWSSLVPPSLGPPDAFMDTTRQLAFLRQHPLRLFSAAYQTLLIYGDNILTQGVFVRGRMSNMIRFTSAIAVVLHLQLVFGIALGSLARLFRGDARRRRIACAWLALSSLAIVTCVSAAIYVCCTEVGAELTRHLQGRYYLPAAPPFLLACALVGRPLLARWLSAGQGGRVLAVLAFNNALCLFTLVGFHYFPAGIQWPL